MHALTLTSLAALAAGATAKDCMNLTVPVTISARMGVFNIPVLQTNMDATTFIQNNTRQGANFTEMALAGYQTTVGTYNISALFCKPSDGNASSPTLQILTHGIGFDKGYWNFPYNNFNYSYVENAVDVHKFCTLSYDRLGIGLSSHGEPLNEIQAPLEIAALKALTDMFRAGSFPGVPRAFKKIVHVGHSFGSFQTYALASMYPDISDGIVLTGFSLNATFVPYFGAGGNFVQANKNQPFRFGNMGSLQAAEMLLNDYDLTDYVAGLDAAPGLNYPNGYLTNANAGALQYLFLLPPFFDPGIGVFAEMTKQPVTVGELLTLGSIPMVNEFAGPVLVQTGSNDLPFCGGDCLATGTSLPSIPAGVAKSFPKASTFDVYIQPNTGHGLTAHYNATGGYDAIASWLGARGLSTTG